MSGIIGKIFSGGAKELVDTIGKTVDRFVTTDADRAEMNQELTRVVNEHHEKHQAELTRRLEIDMNSDSWLSKNIRPLTLIFILATYTIFSITDENLVIAGHAFNINGEYVKLLGQWGEAIMYFYFGGRTIEKAVQAWTSRGKK